MKALKTTVINQECTNLHSCRKEFVILTENCVIILPGECVLLTNLLWHINVLPALGERGARERRQATEVRWKWFVNAYKRISSFIATHFPPPYVGLMLLVSRQRCQKLLRKFQLVEERRKYNNNNKNYNNDCGKNGWKT